jgi:ElaB/YqjD/DUF883 family membrane-anchored ribosome-binding protein
VDATNYVDTPSPEELRADIHATSEALRDRYSELYSHVKNSAERIAAKIPDRACVARHPVAACSVAFCCGALVGLLRLDRRGVRLVGNTARGAARLGGKLALSVGIAFAEEVLKGLSPRS